MRFLKTVLSAACIAVATPASGDKVVVYSARIEQLIWPLFDAYTRDTGVTVKFVTDKEGPLMERLKAEGPNTPAVVHHVGRRGARRLEPDQGAGPARGVSRRRNPL